MGTNLSVIYGLFHLFTDMSELCGPHLFCQPKTRPERGASGVFFITLIS